MKPAFGYLRVSGRGQMEGDGFDRQRDTINRFCQRNGYHILRWFEDGAVSGEDDCADREAFSEMLALAGPGSSTTIIVERSDRLARTLAVGELACESARKAGLQIFDASAETDLTNSDDPTRVAIRQMLGVMAEWNKNVQVKRLAAARTRIRLLKGKCEGKKNYEETEMGVHAASYIRVARGWGWTYRRIASEMNRLGHGPPEGRCWHASTVRKIWLRLQQADKDAARLAECPKQTRPAGSDNLLDGLI